MVISYHINNNVPESVTKNMPMVSYFINEDCVLNNSRQDNNKKIMTALQNIKLGGSSDVLHFVNVCLLRGLVN